MTIAAGLTTALGIKLAGAWPGLGGLLFAVSPLTTEYAHDMPSVSGAGRPADGRRLSVQLGSGGECLNGIGESATLAALVTVAVVMTCSRAVMTSAGIWSRYARGCIGSGFPPINSQDRPLLACVTPSSSVANGRHSGPGSVSRAVAFQPNYPGGTDSLWAAS